MDQAVLVNLEIQRGADILTALDESKIKVSVALYANLPEYGDWRLVLASRSLNGLKITDAFGAVFDALSDAGLSPAKLPIILIYSMSDPFVRGLRKVFAKTSSVEGMRLGGQSFGGRFIDDAFVYRIR